MKEFKRPWKPRAYQLALPHVPAEHRAHVRQRLAPYLRKFPFGIRGGDCWRVAQALVWIARDEGIRYVEGVWNRSPDNEWYEGGDLPAPHAWVTVDGDLVDLIGELYGSDGSDFDWVYEPLHDYSFETVLEMLPSFYGENPQSWIDSDWSTNLSLAMMEWNESWFPESLRRDKEPSSDEEVDEFWKARAEVATQVLFKPAVDRLLARLQPDAAKKAA